MAYEGLLDNKNAEKWTEEKATKLFEKAISMAEDKSKKYDFIGEIARDLKLYKDIFLHLISRFPQLKPLNARLLSCLEANCYQNAKTGNIVASLGIINLKSNHKWTDRVDSTSQGDKIGNTIKVEVVQPTDDDD